MRGDGAPRGATIGPRLRSAGASCDRRARLAALHARRFPFPGPRFLVPAPARFFSLAPVRLIALSRRGRSRTFGAAPVQQSSLRRGRSAPRSGPGTSRVRACEARPRAPPLPHFENASRSAPHWAGILTIYLGFSACQGQRWLIIVDGIGLPYRRYSTDCYYGQDPLLLGAIVEVKDANKAGTAASARS